MGILKFKLTENLPIDYPDDENIGAQYITTFQREQPGEHYPLKDSTGNPIPQVRLSGDYLISEYGSSDAARQRGYENLKQFLKQLPEHMRVAYLKPYQDPYSDAYYSKLGLEKMKIDDRVYYTTKRPVLTHEIEGQLTTLGFGSRSRNPDLIVPYLTPPANDGSDGLDDRLVRMGEEINEYANLVVNRCEFIELEVDFVNNLRRLLEAARRRAVYGNYERSKTSKSSKTSKKETKKNIKKENKKEIKGGHELDFNAIKDKVSANIARIGELTNNAILQQYAYDIRFVQNIKDLLNFASKFQNEWAQYKLNNPNIFAFSEYGSPHNDPKTCNEIEEERFGQGHARIAKQVFQYKIDRLYALTHGSEVNLPDDLIAERVGFLCKFDVSSQEAYDELEDNSWSVLQAAYSLGITKNSPILDDLPPLPPISMLRAHRQQKKQEEQQEHEIQKQTESTYAAIESLPMFETPTKTPKIDKSEIDKSRIEYSKITITANDGKQFHYDGSAKLENGNPVPLDMGRFNDWKVLVDKYNVYLSSDNVKKKRAVFDLKQNISDYNDKYSSQLKQTEYTPSYVGMGESPQSPQLNMSNWVIAAVIVAIMVISVVYQLLTRYETEFPSWIHGAGALGSGLAVAGIIIAWGYQYQIKKLHNSYQK